MQRCQGAVSREQSSQDDHNYADGFDAVTANRYELYECRFQVNTSHDAWWLYCVDYSD